MKPGGLELVNEEIAVLVGLMRRTRRAGEIVASGVYFYKLIAGSFTDTKKMTILK